MMQQAGAAGKASSPKDGRGLSRKRDHWRITSREMIDQNLHLYINPSSLNPQCMVDIEQCPCLAKSLQISTVTGFKLCKFMPTLMLEESSSSSRTMRLAAYKSSKAGNGSMFSQWPTLLWETRLKS